MSERFENKLEEYKKWYLEELQQLNSIAMCDCINHNSYYMNQDYIKWSDDFLTDIINKIFMIGKIFDRIIEIYIEWIKGSGIQALFRMWEFIEEYQLNDVANPLDSQSLFFRGRKKETSLNENNDLEFFHIPFNKRYFVKGQRFSVSGKPMLYLSKSVLGVVKELEEGIDNLTIRGIFLKYDDYYDRKIFMINNYIKELLVNILPGLFASEAQIRYSDGGFSTNSKTIIYELCKSIFCEILTFPKKLDASFVEEYVLPQMLTSLLLEKKYLGIYFPSTKDFSNVNNVHSFSDYYMNLALFIQYDSKHNYDYGLFNTMVVLKSIESDKDTEEILNHLKNGKCKKSTSQENNNSNIIPLVKLKLKLDYFEQARVDDVLYSNTLEGILELKLYEALSERIIKGQTMKILTVFGTRPEAIKMAPLVKALEKEESIDSKVCVTAQHREMLDSVMQLFDITPDYDLNIMAHGQTILDISSKVMYGLDEVLKKERPDLVLVHGDTSTTFNAALAAFYNQIPVGHVEAGLRSFDIYSPFPEEMNRKLTTAIAKFHFAPTEGNRVNLENEGITKGIYITGNTVIDALFQVIDPNYQFEESILNEIDYTQKKVILLTCHRRENWGKPMEDIFRAVKSVVDSSPSVELIFPMHKNPAIRELALKILGSHERIHLIEPLDYVPFTNLMAKSYLVMTDSGGIQEEAPALGKPVIVLRTETERPEAVEAGTVKISGVNYEDIVRDTLELIENEASYQKMANAVNPYGDGKACERIVKIILQK